MIFDTHFILFSLFWALVGAAYTTALTWTAEADQAAVKRSAIISAILTFLGVRVLMYYIMPVFQGSFFGYFEVLATTLATSTVAAFFFGRPNKKAFLYQFVAVCVLVLLPAVLYVSNANWGVTNSKRFASLPNIKVAKSSETMPPTDPSHMVLVTRAVAQFKGAQALQGAVSSRYKIDEASYTLQSVNNHRYWIAPLTLINLGDTLNWTSPESPGYVVVDAENPEVKAKLKDGFHIKLFSEQRWALLVNRYVYQNGYTDGELSTPFFEVDDDWQPYWTFAYMKKPFAGIAGLVLDKIVMVNVAQEEPELQVVKPKDRPDWLDRAIEPSLVAKYATDWGLYGRGLSDMYWSIFWNWNKQETLQPAEIELNYTTDNHNAYIVPMTPTNGSHAVQGVLVFETNHNEATYYPGLNDFMIGDSVRQTMSKVKENTVGYEVDSVQLYSIYGELTWVGIYVAPQANGGKSYAGVGFLHAHSQNPADVVFSNKKSTALSRYKNQLAARQQSGQLISRTADESKPEVATIGRIAPLPGNDQPTYVFVVDGDPHTYRITMDAFPRIPLVKAGDLVSFTHMKSSEDEQAVSTFNCIKCPGMALESAPGAVQSDSNTVSGGDGTQPESGKPAN